MKKLLAITAIFLASTMVNAGEIFTKSDAKLDEKQSKIVEKVKGIPAVVRTEQYEFVQKGIEDDLTFTLPGGDKVEIKTWKSITVHEDGESARSLHWRNDRDKMEAHLLYSDKGCHGMILNNEKVYSVDTLGVSEGKVLILISEVDLSKFPKD